MKRLSFLDGLRGWGAVFVVLYHVFVEGLPVSDASASSLKQIIAFNGSLAVLVFFLVSGFSLSVRYMVEGDKRAWSKMAAGRYFRLMIPIFAACLVVHLSIKAGLIEDARMRLPIFRQILNFDPTIPHLLRFSLFDVFFAYRMDDTYIGPLWTMSIELIGSILVLLAVLALQPARRRGLLLVALAVVIFILPLPSNMPLLALFPLGASIADGFNRGCLDSVPRGVALALLAFGCMVAAIEPVSVGLWGQTAALCILIGCIALPEARKFLGNSFSAWLGKLSFPLYLIHGPMMFIVGEPLTRSYAGSSTSRLAIDLMTITISIVAAIVFMPINEFAIRCSRLIGETITYRVMPTSAPIP